MNLVRVVFVVFATVAVAGTTYVSYFGAGGESSDLDRSVRSASGGRVVGLGGRVK